MSRRIVRFVLSLSASQGCSHQRATHRSRVVGVLGAAAMLLTVSKPAVADKKVSAPKEAGAASQPAATAPDKDTAPAPRNRPLPPEHGLHVGFEVKGSMLSDTLSFLVGPNIGWVLGETWKVGVSGFTMLNTVEPEQLTDAVGRRELELWYATGHVGYVLLAPYAIHIIPVVAAGVGNVTVLRTDLGLGKYKLVPLVEPALEVELAPRPIPFLRAGVLASYRYMFIDEVDNVSGSELSNPAVGAFVRLGSF